MCMGEENDKRYHPLPCLCPCQRVGVLIAPRWSVRVVIKLPLQTHKRNLIHSTTFPYSGRILSLYLTRHFLPQTNVAFRL